ncbi:uncharacterized protein LOC120636932 [Pararge aegeria]|uniref:uncharacterized protein LOC120636932 n=1 Tax=Pararge aegeria TaxID=116150 RepID=UPI0019D0B947|nr:uncharacterized protein LOC120636932 [Pararge aegeria]
MDPAPNACWESVGLPLEHRGCSLRVRWRVAASAPRQCPRRRRPRRTYCTRTPPVNLECSVVSRCVCRDAPRSGMCAPARAVRSVPAAGLLRRQAIVLALLVFGSNFHNAGAAQNVSLAVTAGAARDAALAHLAVRALRRLGLRAHVAPPPAACAPPAAPDARACRDALFAALLRARLAAALVLAPAARAPAAALPLRDAGLQELGDAAPPQARRCYAPARSLLDLADERAAAGLRAADASRPPAGAEPPWCARAACATVLVDDEAELRVLAGVIRAHRLYATAHRAGPGPPPAPAVECGWEPRPGERALGPPPCEPDADDECPFESRRLVKLVNARELARSPPAARALVRLRLSAPQLRELRQLARRWGPEAAAARFADAHPDAAPARELRAAVLLPGASDAFDAGALAAAAALAEADAAADAAGDADAPRFKVEVHDTHCDAARAYAFLNDALHSREYDALTAVFGPACAAAFADVARTAPGPVHALPVVAYTAQAPPADAAVLLAAGDARDAAALLGALFARLGWRRAATLAEAGAPAPLPVELVAHAEAPAAGEAAALARWAARAAAARARVLLVGVAGARTVRAALCAGHAAGLTPRAGAVWVLPAALPGGGLAGAPGDACDAAQLAEMLDGHLSVAPDWALPWLERPDERDNSTEASGPETPEEPGEALRRQWLVRWRAQCRLLGLACAHAGPHAALLYDALRLWDAALRALAAARPAALHAPHDAALVQALLADATRRAHAGVTGRLAWAPAGAARARAAPLLLLQWEAGARRAVARWDGRLALGAPRWRTPDGRAPDDGGDRCALQALADALRCGCRAAAAALGALLLALGAGALAAAALLCRRRAERAHRRRLRELGLHALLPRGIGPDRWEVPRERVVINRKLGAGAFGTVYGGHALLGGAWRAVAVKALKAGASTEEKLDFLAEAETMKRFEHKNVVRLLGVVTRSAPVCAVMELMLLGDLKRWLLARRPPADAPLPARRLTALALDAARALAYLAQLRHVHRDVAARNCLLGARAQLKLADFGMTRVLFEGDYYRLDRKGMLPVRWMAPESLERGVFSAASDVWAYGVLLLEIVTFGALPFRGLTNAEVLARVKAGEAPPLPPGLRPQLAGLLRACWKRDARARPAAAELAAFLAERPRLLTPCLAPDAALPLAALPPDGTDPGAEPGAEADWRLPRWASWAAPSQATDTTELSAD